MAGPDIAQAEPHAPCLVACPVHTDNRLFVQTIVEGRYEDALDLLLSANPFTSVCGRICHHPCEQSCRRRQVDGPLSLRHLKRFVVEQTRDYRVSRRGAAARTRAQRVAVIGSGPAGMTAAHDLARAGFGVTVFEAAPTPGGMLGLTIPRYRLPWDVVREDIDDILALGVELRTGTAVGSDIGFADLQREFDATLIAAGLSESRSLGVPGIDSRGVCLALPMLRAARTGEPLPLGRRVAVIGGGNVAIDAARCARRLGADEVTLYCLESRDEMPAWEWELAEAAEEGVAFAPSWGPMEVLMKDGAVAGMVFRRCVRVFDEAGKFNPAFDDSETAVRQADNIILAIGQRADLSCLQGAPVVVGPGERLQYDAVTMTASEPGVFACGEVVTGPGAAVEAVADGHRAARAIQHYLETGELLQQPRDDLEPLADLPADTIERIPVRARVEVALSPAESRVGDFSEIERSLTETEARAEARRCVSCTAGAFADEERCAACLTCVRMCPFGVASVTTTAVMPQEKCQACGLCAAVCPAAAVALKRYGAEQLREDLQRRFVAAGGGAAPRRLVAFCCLFDATSREMLADDPDEAARTGVTRVMVPCVGRLSVPDLLAPFELGADGVCVIACAQAGCLYPTAEGRLAQRVQRAQQVLSEIGVDSGRIDLYRPDGPAEASWRECCEESRRKLERMHAERRSETQ